MKVQHYNNDDTVIQPIYLLHKLYTMYLFAKRKRYMYKYGIVPQLLENSLNFGFYTSMS